MLESKQYSYYLTMPYLQSDGWRETDALQGTSQLKTVPEMQTSAGRLYLDTISRTSSDVDSQKQHKKKEVLKQLYTVLSVASSESP